MAQIQTRLDSQTSQIEQIDIFTRIMNCEFYDEEEVRYDRPDNYINTAAYIGVALAGSSILDPVWACVRRLYDGRGKVYRDQFRMKMAWNDRANGWN